MVRPFKKLISKLEIPKDDWGLSRFGGGEPPSNPAATDHGRDEEAPVSQAPPSVAARIFQRLFEPGTAEESTLPPQSGERLSSNASADKALELSADDEHKSR